MKPILVTVLASLLAVPAQGSPDSLTLEVDARTVTYGDVVSLSGVLSPASEVARVTVLALPYDGGQEATVTTPDAEGRWRLAARPLVTTQFRAVAGTVDSADAPVVSVRPRVHLVVLSARRGLFYTRVEALSGYEGRTAAFQRLGARGWRTIEHVRLGSRGAVRFRARLPLGSSRVRVSTAPVPGYSAGVSRTARVRT
jgi:hypothetical protein